MNQAGSGIVVIEDADTFKVTQERAPRRPQQSYGMQAADVGSFTSGPRRGEEEPSGITLSGLLNAIDGIASAEGRILFITSNHPDALDAALLRPGRIDVRERLGLAHASVARQMFAAFFPDADGEAFAREIAPRLPLAPAAIQNILLERCEHAPAKTSGNVAILHPRQAYGGGGP
jgi:mitochondrial chaperone BCS1